MSLKVPVTECSSLRKVVRWNLGIRLVEFGMPRVHGVGVESGQNHSEGQEAHKRLWQRTSDEGTGDRQATAVTQAWQNSLMDLQGVTTEEAFSDKYNERIDVVDSVEQVAYELKVSPNNPTSSSKTASRSLHTTPVGEGHCDHSCFLLLHRARTAEQWACWIRHALN